MPRRGKRAHHQLTFAVLAIGIAAFALLQSLVIPVLSTVQAELHTSQSAVTWVLTAYLLSASVMTPILGRVGDLFGKKWVFVAALAALAVGSVLAALAPSGGIRLALSGPTSDQVTDASPRTGAKRRVPTTPSKVWSCRSVANAPMTTELRT